MRDLSARAAPREAEAPSRRALRQQRIEPPGRSSGWAALGRGRGSGSARASIPQPRRWLPAAARLSTQRRWRRRQLAVPRCRMLWPRGAAGLAAAAVAGAPSAPYHGRRRGQGTVCRAAAGDAGAQDRVAGAGAAEPVVLRLGQGGGELNGSWASLHPLLPSQLEQSRAARGRARSAGWRRTNCAAPAQLWATLPGATEPQPYDISVSYYALKDCRINKARALIADLGLLPGDLLALALRAVVGPSGEQLLGIVWLVYQRRTESSPGAPHRLSGSGPIRAAFPAALAALVERGGSQPVEVWAAPVDGVPNALRPYTVTLSYAFPCNTTRLYSVSVLAWALGLNNGDEAQLWRWPDGRVEVRRAAVTGGRALPHTPLPLQQQPPKTLEPPPPNPRRPTSPVASAAPTTAERGLARQPQPPPLRRSPPPVAPSTKRAAVALGGGLGQAVVRRGSERPPASAPVSVLAGGRRGGGSGGPAVRGPLPPPSAAQQKPARRQDPPELVPSPIHWLSGPCARLPLHSAAFRGHAEAVAQLLAGGWGAGEEDGYGRTPLWLAASEGRLAAVGTLLRAGACPNAAASDGRTPLGVAAAGGFVGVVEALVEAGARVNARAGEGGLTALHAACRAGEVAAVRALLRAGADWERATALGQTPLHLACSRGHVAAVRALLEAGADAGARDGAGRTPLDLADSEAEAGGGRGVSMLPHRGTGLQPGRCGGRPQPSGAASLPRPLVYAPSSRPLLTGSPRLSSSVAAASAEVGAGVAAGSVGPRRAARGGGSLSWSAQTTAHGAGWQEQRLGGAPEGAGERLGPGLSSQAPAAAGGCGASLDPAAATAVAVETGGVGAASPSGGGGGGGKGLRHLRGSGALPGSPLPRPPAGVAALGLAAAAAAAAWSRCHGWHPSAVPRRRGQGTVCRAAVWGTGAQPQSPDEGAEEGPSGGEAPGQQGEVVTRGMLRHGLRVVAAGPHATPELRALGVGEVVDYRSGPQEGDWASVWWRSSAGDVTERCWVGRVGGTQPPALRYELFLAKEGGSGEGDSGGGTAARALGPESADGEGSSGPGILSQLPPSPSEAVLRAAQLAQQLLGSWASLHPLFPAQLEQSRATRERARAAGLTRERCAAPAQLWATPPGAAEPKPYDISVSYSSVHNCRINKAGALIHDLGLLDGDLVALVLRGGEVYATLLARQGERPPRTRLALRASPAVFAPTGEQLLGTVQLNLNKYYLAGAPAIRAAFPTAVEAAQEGGGGQRVEVLAAPAADGAPTGLRPYALMLHYQSSQCSVRLHTVAELARALGLRHGDGVQLWRWPEDGRVEARRAAAPGSDPLPHSPPPVPRPAPQAPSPAAAASAPPAAEAGQGPDEGSLGSPGQQLPVPAPALPLHSAAFRGHAEAVAQLLAGGWGADEEDGSRRTPLWLAASEGRLAAVGTLLRAGACPNAAASDGRTPLGVAAAGGFVGVVEALVEAGARVNARAGDVGGGLTALHAACRAGEVAAVRALLRAGADWERATALGQTPLHLACSRGHVAAVRALLEAGADAGARDGAGRTPLDLADSEAEAGGGRVGEELRAWRADAGRRGRGRGL
ncbi:hypothetical protein HYH03_015127 [Edaphochlamys debaryana]|uniref:Uncharacterized protein n=1 Tax=Edaphochlamys debaryana TaxID=47281 RepID=A0A836BSV1_9CHLO|nr:hypothetical protein HYH03_015127 [Edaphochlamys debaryana]|eukprot:KAG2486163.1 hypothetical protein HYH03_015127 [Edaphochlamys debaryana]